jgi:hypothetical protein
MLRFPPPFFSPGRRLVGTTDSAIDVVDLPIELASGIGLLFKRIKHVLEDTGFLPAIEAARHRAPRAIALWQIVPGGAGAQNPQHAIKDATMVDGWPPGLRFLGREQRSELLPLRVGQVSSVHSTR